MPVTEGTGEILVGDQRAGALMFSDGNRLRNQEHGKCADAILLFYVAQGLTEAVCFGAVWCFSSASSTSFK